MQCSNEITQEAAQATIVCVASSFNWLYLASLCLVFISVIVATWGVRTARASARQRATLDLIEKVESTPHYQELNRAFSYRRRTDTFAALHSPTEVKDQEDRRKVSNFLNHYELVSIGISEKILDEKFYRNWMAGPFIRDWNAASEFIQNERWKWDAAAKKWIYHAQVFENYQDLATRWSSQAIRLTAETMPPPKLPSGPGDEAYPSSRD